MLLYLLIFALGFVVGMRWQATRLPTPVRQGPPPERDVTDAEIEELLGRGDKLGAIRRYREIHRCDVETALRRVELLEAILKR